MRHRSNDLFSRPGTVETKSLGSRQISAKGCRVKGSIRNVLWNRNRESHFLSLQAPKRLSRHHLSHDETLQWARRQAIGENDKLIKIPATTLVLRRNIARIPVRRDGAVLDAPVTRAHFPLTLSINFP